MSNKDAQVILKSVAAVLKDERAQTDKRIDDVAGRIDSIDGNSLIKSAAVAVADANLSALREHAETVTLRKSKHLDGDLPPVAKGLLE